MKLSEIQAQPKKMKLSELQAQQQAPQPVDERPSITGGRGIAAQQSQQRNYDFKKQMEERIPLYQGDASQLKEIGAAPELNQMSMPAFKSSLAANLIGSDFELAQALEQQYPGTTFSRDKDLNLIATMPSGGSFYLNAPGISGQDVVKFATRAGAYAVPGAGSLPIVAAKAAGTEALLQGAEQQVGGDFNAADVAIAGVAAPIGQAVGSKIASVAEKAAANKALKMSAPSSDQLKIASNQIYQQLDDLGVVVDQAPLGKLSGEIAKTVKQEGFNARLHPKVAAVLDEIGYQAEKPMTLSEIDTLRKVAKSAASSIEPSEARLGRIAVEKIDDFLNDLPESSLQNANGADIGGLFKQARTYWGQAKKSDLLQGAVEKARNQASGFENGIRVQFRAILNNPKKVRGFSKDEVDAMKLVVRGGPTENILKALGKFGFTEGQATNMLLGSLGVAGGAAVGGPGGAVAVPMIGQVSKTLAQRLTRNNAAFADQVIRAGRDGQKIALAYIRSTPKSQRSVAELTELLMRPGVSIDAARSSGNKLIADAAFAAALAQSQAIPIKEGVNSLLDGQDNNNGQ